MFRAYLVDDELPAVKRLARLLQATGRVEIVGAEMNPVAAIEAIRVASPDILFLDIQMPGLTGFDLLARIERQPFVIFTTAYDQYALKAFEVNSIDYLLKPVEPEELDRALNKLEQFQNARGPVDLRGVLEALSRHAPVQRVPIRMGERTRFLEVGRITHFFTQGRLTFAAADGKTHAVDCTIAELEQKLGPSRFFRIHRGTLVNLDWLEELTPWFTGRMAARLKDEKRTELIVARDRVRLLKRHLGL
uniref:Response regulator receiver protein n=1 Tax=Solibacter usitatus (strain Ellin6076) TaxID=234267 RepID=Q025M1_SOLUE